MVLQVTILVSLLTSPVVSLIFGVINRGPGDSVVRSMLWSQAFIVLTAVSLAWSVHGVITLRKILDADAAAAAADPRCAADDDTSNADTTAGTSCHKPQRARALPTSLSPEACIIQAAEVILAGSPGSAADEDAALAALATTAVQARSRGLTIDTPVLQTEKSLRAWSKVISHQGEVERDIRETHRWGVLGEKLISMNGGMPLVVAIIQVWVPCPAVSISCDSDNISAAENFQTSTSNTRLSIGGSCHSKNNRVKLLISRCSAKVNTPPFHVITPLSK